MSNRADILQFLRLNKDLFKEKYNVVKIGINKLIIEMIL